MYKRDKEFYKERKQIMEKLGLDPKNPHSDSVIEQFKISEEGSSE
jgi:hypothetical protein